MAVPAVSRADLLRCLHAEGRDALAAMAGFAGYRRRPVPEARASLRKPSGRRVEPAKHREAPLPLPEPSKEAVQGVTFYRVVGYRPIARDLPRGERPQWYYAARLLTAAERRQQASAPPEPEPLVPWSRLWPLLRAALGLWGERREPDVDRLVDLVARGHAPRRLPRRRRQRWACACQVILDLSIRLTAFHPDYWLLLTGLGRLRGHIGLDVFVLSHGPDGDFRRLGTPEASRYQPPAPDVPVLILGDLGCLGEATERAAWRRFGRRLRHAGLTPVALMPCPPRFWDPRLAGLFFPVTWDRSHRLPRSVAGPRPWPAFRAEPVDDAGAGRLLDLLAPAVRIEPALLRALRHALPDAGLDVGCEAAAWVHPHVEATPFALSWADQRAVQGRRNAYRGYPDLHRRCAGDLIRRHHAHLPPSVRTEEAANLAELDRGQLDAEAGDYLACTLRTLEQADGGLRASLTAWAARFGARQHAAAWRDPRRTAIWVLAHRDQLRSGACALPPGLELADADWVLDRGGETASWSLRQQGTELVLAPQALPATRAPGERSDAADGPDEAQPPGSRFAGLALSGLPIQYTHLGDEGGGKHSIPPRPGARLALAEPGLRLRTDDAELTIASLRRPAWAAAIGRDGSGLHVEVVEGEGTRRLRWVSPADALALERAPQLGVVRMPTGAFWDEQDHLAWLRDELAQPGWAQRAGVDEHGLFAELHCSGVIQRLRSIWLGAFVMGSPRDEPERLDDERQHEVVFTPGFWLADTACTQALWEAVMGKSPSQFKGAERPVEQVSWEQVQGFVARLNGALPGLDLRLPTEAEWEHACRAGTRTAFWFGDRITTEQVNYDGNTPYAGGEQGRYREETVEVKALPCNAWGLYQMHGNVWEWCADWYGAYPAEAVEDPSGPAAGGWRVLRGGGWFAHARDCRSARRIHGGPGYRDDYLGFRLARGP